ncbi:MAG: signal recognition particle protein [Phycisphaerales bacterium]|nr:signal recognition particle protein [Phycisphaerales bacterium]
MFAALTDRFSEAFRRLSGRGTITETNVREVMEEVRTALLEADVHQEVVNTLCEEILQDALGTAVIRSLKPAAEMIGIVHKRLVEVMGAPSPGISLVEPGPTVVMMCGLQGSGKTTTCGKLAAYLRKRGQSVLVCAADLQRPAAVEQLRIVVESVAQDGTGSGRVAFHGEPDKCAEHGRATGAAVGVCQRALRRARDERFDVLIIDTAGRLHIDEPLMGELAAIDRAVEPHQILLVVDAMSGQDAVASASSFHARLAVDGVILTKFDSDTRGGAALSVRRITGAPIKFVGVGERSTALEEFHPERIAGRILGMGDVVSLAEKAHEAVDEAEAARMAEKMAQGKLSLDDLVSQMRMLRKLGPIKQLLGMLPGVGSALKGLEFDETQLDRLQGIVHSMTPSERTNVSSLDKSRIRRVAAGSGVPTADVTKLTRQFESMQKLGMQLGGMGALGRAGAMREMARSGPGGLSSKGSSRTESIKAKFKKRR